MGKALAMGLVGLLLIGAIILGYQDAILFDYLYAPDHAFEEEDAPADTPFVLTESGSGAVAVFFVGDTKNFQAKRWNLAADDMVGAGAPPEIFANADVFRNDCCTLVKVGYQQAAFHAMRPSAGANGEKAMDRAYESVAAAFTRFHDAGGDRPYVLAGQGQGSVLLARLIAEQGLSEDPGFIVAYLPGAALPAGAVMPCEDPKQHGCVLSWNMFDGTLANLGLPPVVVAGAQPPFICNPPIRQDEMAVCDADGRLLMTFEHKNELARWRGVEFPGGSLHGANYALMQGFVRHDLKMRAGLK